MSRRCSDDDLSLIHKLKILVKRGGDCVRRLRRLLRSPTLPSHLTRSGHLSENTLTSGCYVAISLGAEMQLLLNFSFKTD